MNPTIEQIRAANTGIWTCPATPSDAKPDPRFIPVTGWGEVTRDDQFVCPVCQELAWRFTQRIAHMDSGQVCCTSCLIDQIFDGHGRIVGKYSAIIEPTNTANLTPGKWTMTSRQGRLA